MYFSSCDICIFPVEDSFQQASDGSRGPWVGHTHLWDPCWLLCLLEQVHINLESSLNIHLQKICIKRIWNKRSQQNIKLWNLQSTDNLQYNAYLRWKISGVTPVEYVCIIAHSHWKSTKRLQKPRKKICRFIFRGWPKEDWGDPLCTATGFVLTFTGKGRLPWLPVKRGISSHSN